MITFNQSDSLSNIDSSQGNLKETRNFNLLLLFDGSSKVVRFYMDIQDMSLPLLSNLSFPVFFTISNDLRHFTAQASPLPCSTKSVLFIYIELFALIFTCTSFVCQSISAGADDNNTKQNVFSYNQLQPFSTHILSLYYQRKTGTTFFFKKTSNASRELANITVS